MKLVEKYAKYLLKALDGFNGTDKDLFFICVGMVDMIFKEFSCLEDMVVRNDWSPHELLSILESIKNEMKTLKRRENRLCFEINDIKKEGVQEFIKQLADEYGISK